MCTCGICGATFSSHTALSDHIFRDHGNNVNWNSRIIAAFAALIIALALFVSPAKAQTSPLPQPTPSIGEPPHMIYRVFLPIAPLDAYVHGCDDCAQAVSWCPVCNPAAS